MFTCMAPPQIHVSSLFLHKTLLSQLQGVSEASSPNSSPLSPARLRKMKLFLPGYFTSPPALDENTAGHWPSSDSVQRLGTSHSWRLKSHSQSQPSYCLTHKCTSRALSCWQMECFAPHFEMSRKSDILQMKRQWKNLNIIRICPKVHEETFALAVSPDPMWCTWHWNRLEHTTALQNSRSSLVRNLPCFHNCTHCTQTF